MTSRAGGRRVEDGAGGVHVRVELNFKPEHQFQEEFVVELIALVRCLRPSLGVQEPAEPLAEEPPCFGRSMGESGGDDGFSGDGAKAGRLVTHAVPSPENLCLPDA
jgi:hypothetical protein